MRKGKVVDLISKNNTQLPPHSIDYLHFGGCFIEDSSVNRANGSTPMGRGSSWGIAFELCNDTRAKEITSPLIRKKTGEPTSDDLEPFFRRKLKITHEDDILEEQERKFLKNIIFKWRKKFSKRLALNLIRRVIDIQEKEIINFEIIENYIRNRVPGHVTRRDMELCLRKMYIDEI